MNKKYVSVLFSIIITISFQSCDSFHNNFSGINNFEINLNLDSIRIVNVNIDNIQSEIIYPDLTIDDKFIKSDDDTVFFAKPTSCLLDKGYYYILDAGLNAIIQLDTTGHYVKTISREGKGPGEFLDPFTIGKLKNHFLVFDTGNSRLQFFDNNFEYINSISASYFPFMQSLSFTNNSLLVPTAKHNVYEVFKQDAIANYEIKLDMQYTFPTSSLNTHIGKLPYTMKVKIIDDNTICYFYHSYPYIFFSDLSGKTFMIVELSGELVKEIFEYKKDGENGGIAMHLTDLGVVNSKLLLILNQKILIFDYSGSNCIIEKIFEIPDDYRLSSIDIYGKYLYTYEWSRARVVRYKLY